MAAWSSLTPDQQSQVLGFMASFRPRTGQLARTFDNLRQLNDYWLNNAQGINALLDSTVVIPDSTGLAGATTLTSANLITIMGAVATLLSTYNTGGNRALMADIAGIANITGA